MPRVRVVLALGLPDPDRLSTTLLWSVLAHIGVVVGVLIYQSLPSSTPLRDAPYFVRLAAPPPSPAGSGASAAPLAPVAPPVVEAPPHAKPLPSKASAPREILNKKPPEPRAKLEPPPPPPSTEAPAVAAPSGSAAPAHGAEPPGPPGGGVGATSFGDGDFQYDWYRGAIEAKLRSQWRRPIATTTETQAASVSFTIRRDGSVQSVAIASPSGNEVLDLSVVRAVYDAAPLPALPRSYKNDSVHVTMEFQLAPGSP